MSATVHSLERHRQARAGTEPWQTKQEIAKHYGFSPRWVELRLRDGMPHRRIGGRPRFQLGAVDRWLSMREDQAS